MECFHVLGSLPSFHSLLYIFNILASSVGGNAFQVT